MESESARKSRSVRFELETGVVRRTPKKVQFLFEEQQETQQCTLEDYLDDIDREISLDEFAARLVSQTLARVREEEESSRRAALKEMAPIVVRGVLKDLVADVLQTVIGPADLIEPGTPIKTSKLSKVRNFFSRLTKTCKGKKVRDKNDRNDAKPKTKTKVRKLKRAKAKTNLAIEQKSATQVDEPVTQPPENTEDSSPKGKTSWARRLLSRLCGRLGGKKKGSC